ncbi:MULTISPECIES: tyrosine-type recombinase/integrase [Deinococcus]|uniref:Tyrosine-type recombinase/integrase n=1 Tax=Deinococcus rufus TaxID=2136097 RepID=A0ABV7Z2J2_9DEIO|nr:tyrosine-type recombinase/integrase [Deinococcus sp. AB2017081]WQE95830.1 tyrosine-type recombinase/integrase [Deinococcus sp. AB2017081]
MGRYGDDRPAARRDPQPALEARACPGAITGEPTTWSPAVTAPRPDSLRRLFHTLCAQAGVRPMRLHDLRGITATHLAQQGVPMDMVAKILGHASAAATRTFYMEVQIGEVKEAIARPPLLSEPDSKGGAQASAQDEGRGQSPALFAAP